MKKVGKIGSGVGRKKREPAGGSRREGQVEEEKGVTGRNGWWGSRQKAAIMA